MQKIIHPPPKSTENCLYHLTHSLVSASAPFSLVRWGGKRSEPPHALLFSVSSRPAKCAPFRALLCASAARDAGWGEISCFPNDFNQGVHFNTFVRLNRFLHFWMVYLSGCCHLLCCIWCDAAFLWTFWGDDALYFREGENKGYYYAELIASYYKCIMWCRMFCVVQPPCLAQYLSEDSQEDKTRGTTILNGCSVQKSIVEQCFYWHYVYSGQI